MSHPTLNILYHDDYLIAIAKPAGLLVHRSLIDQHESRFALQMLRDQIGQKVFPIHRLDKPTFGILLFALDRVTARLLAEQFQASLIEKRYQAISRGWLKENKCRVDYPLQEKRDKIADKKARVDKPAQTAITEFTSLEQFLIPTAVGPYPNSRFEYLEAKPLTGRKHQIRRHLKHIFHPLMGDTTYGEGRYNRFFRDVIGINSLMLSATNVTFKHPHTQEAITINSPPSSDFLKALTYLKDHTIN